MILRIAQAPEGEHVLNEKGAVHTALGVVRIEDLPVKETPVEKNGLTSWTLPPGTYIDTLDTAAVRPGRQEARTLLLRRGVPMQAVRLGAKRNFPRTVTVPADGRMLVWRDGGIAAVPPAEAAGLMVPRIMAPVPRELPPERPALGFAVGEMLGILATTLEPGDGAFSAVTKHPQLAYFLVSRAKGHLPLVPGGVADIYSAGEGLSRVRLPLKEKTAGELRAAMTPGDGTARLPAGSLEGSEEHLEGLLTGLLEESGLFSYNKGVGGLAPERSVSLTFDSPALRDGTILLCARLGIRTSVSVGYAKRKELDTWRVSLSVTDLAARAASSGRMVLRVPHKQRLLGLMASEEPGPIAMTKADSVPWPGHLGRELAWAKPPIACSRRHDASRDGKVARAVAIPVADALREADWKSYKPPKHKWLEGSPVRSPKEAKTAVEAWCDLVDSTALRWELVAETGPDGAGDAWGIVTDSGTFADADGFVFLSEG